MIRKNLKHSAVIWETSILGGLPHANVEPDTDHLLDRKKIGTKRGRFVRRLRLESGKVEDCQARGDTARIEASSMMNKAHFR
jgi:hypothetical protein